MRRFILFNLLVFGTFSSIAQNSAKLHGHVVNPNSDSVFIFQYIIEEGKSVKKKIASDLLVDNKFEMSIEVDNVSEFIFSDGNETSTLLLGPGDDLDLYLNTAFFDETMSFSGTGAVKNNAIGTLYLIEENMSMALFDGLNDSDTASLFKEFDNSQQAYRKLIEEYNATVPDFKNYGENLLIKSEQSVPQMKKYVEREFAFREKMKELVGKEAIDFEGINLDGKRSKLSDYKGKMIVVDFWATWCGPCKAEFPAYKELEKQYGEDVHFVSVAISCEEDAWREMATDEGFANNIYLSKKDVKQINDYQVYGIPRYLVIDKDFNLVDANAPRPSSGQLPSFWE